MHVHLKLTPYGCVLVRVLVSEYTGADLDIADSKSLSSRLEVLALG